MFLRNSIQALAGDGTVAEAEFVQIGEATGRTGVGRAPDGTRRRLDRDWPGPPGFWQIDDARVAVNFVESSLDLTAADRPSDPVVDVGAPAVPDHPLTPAFAAAAFLLLLVGWWWFWR